MIKNEITTARTSVKVQEIDVDSPDWMVKEASQRSFEKGVDLVNSYQAVVNQRVDKNIISYDVKGSKGRRYIVRVSIFDRKKNKRPTTLECNCKHGLHGTSGMCYHKVAVILKLYSLPFMPVEYTPQNYEDDFSLED